MACQKQSYEALMKNLEGPKTDDHTDCLSISYGTLRRENITVWANLGWLSLPFVFGRSTSFLEGRGIDFNSSAAVSEFFLKEIFLGNELHFYKKMKNF